MQGFHYSAPDSKEAPLAPSSDGDFQLQAEKKKYRPAYKVHLAPAEDVQDETLISIGKLHVLKEKCNINSFVRDPFILFLYNYL